MENIVNACCAVSAFDYQEPIGLKMYFAKLVVVLGMQALHESKWVSPQKMALALAALDAAQSVAICGSEKAAIASVKTRKWYVIRGLIRMGVISSFTYSLVQPSASRWFNRLACTLPLIAPALDVYSEVMFPLWERHA